MPQMHSFWVYPIALNSAFDRILHKRVTNLDSVSLQPCSMGETVELINYLQAIIKHKAYKAVHVSNNIMLDHFQSFLTVRVLRDGHIPCRGFPMDSIGVIPFSSLQELMNVLELLPDSPTWSRLMKLCREAYAKNTHLIYQGITVGQNY